MSFHDIGSLAGRRDCCAIAFAAMTWARATQISDPRTLMPRAILSVIGWSPRSAISRRASGTLLPDAILYRPCGLGQCRARRAHAGCGSRRVVAFGGRIAVVGHASDLSGFGLGGGAGF
jgi:hypothetical protein